MFAEIKLPKIFSADLQNFNDLKKWCCPRAKDRAIFEDLTPRGQGLDLRGQGQGHQNVSSRTSSRPRTSYRTPPLVPRLNTINLTQVDKKRPNKQFVIIIVTLTYCSEHQSNMCAIFSLSQQAGFYMDEVKT